LTLIELIFVILFVAIALVTLLYASTEGLRKSVSSEHLTVALHLAQEKMEQIFSDKEGKGYTYIIPENYPEEVNPDGCVGYTRRVEIETYSGYKRITVRVSHEGMPDVHLETLLANY